MYVCLYHRHASDFSIKCETSYVKLFIPFILLLHNIIDSFVILFFIQNSFASYLFVCTVQHNLNQIPRV